MKNPEEIFELLKAKFGDSVISLEKDAPTETIITVQPLEIHRVGDFLRVNDELMFDSLMCLSGVDDANGTKVKDAEGYDAIQGGTLSVYYHLHSTSLKHKITIKCQHN